MRLHHLEITAFGPFADTVEVDLDALSAAGLFLLSGPTGAGKTSVLDAVCFALFGDVPGDRAVAKRLRCDQAAPGVQPRVRLEATLGGRRLLISRTPAWERPKKRGTGLTSEHASVTVSELRGGAWSPLTSRLDEAGDLLGSLLGMSLTQFTQVALLPQGRFQAFLRARADERHQLLQRLFRTGRFEDVERWLRERRLDQRRRRDSLLGEIAVLTGRVLEAGDADLPDGVEGVEAEHLAEPAADGTLLAWARSLRTTTTEALTRATDVVAATADAEAECAERLRAAETLAEAVVRVVALRREEDELDAAATEAAAADERLAIARRAAAVRPYLELSARAARRSAEAVRDRATALAALDPHDLAAGEPDLDALPARAAEAAERVAALRAALPQERRLQDVMRRRPEVLARHEALRREARALDERATLLPQLLQEAVDRRDLAVEAEQRVETLEVRAGELERRRIALVEHARLAAQLLPARQAHVEARDAALTAREHLLELREARIAGMAAELASGLAVGACCPVCGSADHPHKASTHGAVDADLERAAQHALDDAQALEHARAEAVRDLEVALTRLEERAGGDDLAAAEAEAATLAEELSAARSAALDHAPARGTLTALEAEADDLAARVTALRTETAVLAERETALAAEEDDLARALTALLEAHGAPTLADALSAAEAARRRLERAAAAVAAEQAAQEASRETESDLATALAEAALPDRDAALDAMLDDRTLQALTEQVEAHAARRAVAARTRAALEASDPTLLLDPEPVAPDLAPLTAQHETAQVALTEARTALARATERAGRLASLLGELESLLASWAPLAREHERTARLSAFVEGKSADNRLQMRLSAYVLAYRLAQVVEAANVRLGRMTDQRYRLEHTAERGQRETRGGLGLLVRDDWSGEARDPATLSGGETFVVSLALALGLADVITGEVGGASLDTLFVDEGFGSLDADTLDDVLDTLDALRDGGRVVGVVSHVAEMRDRIPTQLLVGKSRTGSTLTVRLGAAEPA